MADPLVGYRNYESPHPECLSAACSAVPLCPERDSAPAGPLWRAAFGHSDYDGSTALTRQCVRPLPTHLQLWGEREREGE